MAIARTHHSVVASIMKDGRIMVSSGGDPCSSATCRCCGDMYFYMEIRTPPYLYNTYGGGSLGTRLVIEGDPLTTGSLDETFRVRMTNQRFDSLALICVSAVTHAVHNDQTGSRQIRGHVCIQVADNSNITLPALNYVFVMDMNGVDFVEIDYIPLQAKIYDTLKL